MKTEIERKAHAILRFQMNSKAHSLGVTPSQYFAVKLGIGGVHADQSLINKFADDNKKLTYEQTMALIVELGCMDHIKPYDEDKLKTQSMRLMSEIGNISKSITDNLNGDGILDESELKILLKLSNKLNTLSQELHWSLEETRGNL